MIHDVDKNAIGRKALDPQEMTPDVCRLRSHRLVQSRSETHGDDDVPNLEVPITFPRFYKARSGAVRCRTHPPIDFRSDLRRRTMDVRRREVVPRHIIERRPR